MVLISFGKILTTDRVGKNFVETRDHFQDHNGSLRVGKIWLKSGLGQNFALDFKKKPKKRRETGKRTENKSTNKTRNRPNKENKKTRRDENKQSQTTDENKTERNEIDKNEGRQNQQ